MLSRAQAEEGEWVQYGMLVGAGVPDEKPMVLLGAGSVLSPGKTAKDVA